ncbi:MAG: PRTRC system protein E [Burkholderiales bacterium]
MFAELKPLLDNCFSVTIVLAAGSDDTLSVTVIPKAKDGQNAVLSTPLALTGTLAELDAEFAGLVTGFAAKRITLAQQLEATETILEAAKQEAAKSAVSGKKKALPKLSSGVTDDDGGNDDDDDQGVGCCGSPEASVPATPSAEDDLWA